MHTLKYIYIFFVSIESKVDVVPVLSQTVTKLITLQLNKIQILEKTNPFPHILLNACELILYTESTLSLS